MSNRALQDPGLPARQPTASYWQQPLHSGLSSIQSTSLPTNRDVVIIGSGITACSVARELLQSPRDLTLTVLEAREVCSGATGRNGGRINCVAVLDYDKYYQKFGKEAATKIVRFELAHFDRILAAAKELGLEDFEKSEVREVGTCAAVFEDEQLADLRQKLANFEAAFPDLQGRWRIADQKEAIEVRFLLSCSHFRPIRNTAKSPPDVQNPQGKRSSRRPSWSCMALPAYHEHLGVTLDEPQQQPDHRIQHSGHEYSKGRSERGLPVRHQHPSWHSTRAAHLSLYRRPC